MADMHRSTVRHLSRRHVLFGIALSGAGTILAACAPPPAPTATSAPQPTAAPAKPAEASAKPTEAPAKPTEAPKPAAEATKPAAAATPAIAPTAPAAAPAAAAPAAKKVTGPVEIWTRETGGGGSRQPLIKKNLEDFDKATGATTKVQFMVFQESIQKTQAAIAAGTPPEVAQQGPDVTMGFAAAGHLTALDDVYKELGPQNFAQLQKDAYVNWKGKIYGIPWYIETRILYYHKDLFEKAGVKAPTLWAEWVDAARKLTQGDQFGTLYSFEGPGAGQFWISLAQANGALVLDKDGNVVADSPQMVEGLQFAGDLLVKHKVMPEAAPTYKGTDVNQLFFLKKVAMVYGNGQVIDDITNQKKELLPNLGGVLMPINKPDQTTRSFLGGFHLFAMKAAKNPDAGLELLKWMYREPWYTDYMKFTNGATLPVTRAGVESDYFQKDELKKLLVQQESTAVRYGGPVYGNIPFMGEAEGKLLFSNALTNLVAGKATAAEAIKTLDGELKALAKDSPK
jgi:multiple sugar transport system substrate-binding protein